MCVARGRNRRHATVTALAPLPLFASLCTSCSVLSKHDVHADKPRSEEHTFIAEKTAKDTFK